MRFLSSVRRWLEKNVRIKHGAIFGAMFLLTMTIGSLAAPQFVSAQDESPSGLEIANDVLPGSTFRNGVMAAGSAAKEALIGPSLTLESAILWVTSVINWITSTLASFSLSIIEMIIVPILQYNSFSESPTIGLGWSLVRDVVNMFVVLILLVIAVATIVGYKKMSWEQNLPQFLFAVVLVNFSRTICGILIDISQVVMFTFVNALLDVAAGNFAVLLGYDEYGRYSEGAIRVAGSSAINSIEPAMQLGAAYLLFILYAVICAVLLMLALVFIWRIIVLWILVIMSPLTFFLGGIKGIFNFANGAYSNWWSKFAAALTIGPMLTFFLWLALATATGDIVKSEGFKQPDSAVTVTLEAFETSNLLGTMLGLILLVIGMQQASATANSLGGLAKSVMGNEKTGENLVKGAIGLAGGYAVARGASTVGNTAGRGLAKGTDKLAGYGIRAGEAMGKVPLVGGVMGRSVIDSVGYVQQKAQGYEKSGQAEAKKRIAAMTDNQKAASIGLLGSGRTGAVLSSTRDDIQALMMDLDSNSALRKSTKKSMSTANHSAMMKNIVDMTDDEVLAAGGNLNEHYKTQSQNVHLMEPAARKKFVKSKDFDPKAMSEEAAGSMDVRNDLKQVDLGNDENGNKITADDELLAGKYGVSQRNAAKGANKKKVYDADSVAEGAEKGDRLNSIRTVGGFAVEDIASSILAGRLKVDKLTHEDLSGPNAEALTRAILQTGSSERLTDPAAGDLYLEKAKTLQRSGALAGLEHQTLEVDVTTVRKLDPGIQATATTFEGTLGPGELGGRIQRALEKDQMLFSKFKDMSTAGPDAEEVQNAIVDAIDRKSLRDMTATFKSSIDPAEQAAIKANIDVIANAIEKHVERNRVKYEKAAGTGKPYKLDSATANNYNEIRAAAGIVGARKPPSLI